MQNYFSLALHVREHAEMSYEVAMSRRTGGGKACLVFMLSTGL